MVYSSAASFVPRLDLLRDLKIPVLGPSKAEGKHSGRVPPNSDVPPCVKTCRCLSITLECSRVVHHMYTAFMSWWISFTTGNFLKDEGMKF